MNVLEKILLGSLALAGALGINATDANAKPLIRFIPVAEAPAAYTDKVDALSYIAEELRVTDPGCQAYQSLLRYQREIRSGKAEPSAVREMAALYRAGQHNPKGDPIGDIIGDRMGRDKPVPAQSTVKSAPQTVAKAKPVVVKPVTKPAKALTLEQIKALHLATLVVNDAAKAAKQAARLM